MPRPATRAEFEDAVAQMERRVPLGKDVSITFKRERITDGVGYALLDDDTGRFTVAVDARLDLYAMQETLIHEVAHVLDWRPYTAWTQDHGPTWGVCYSQVYQAYHQLM